MFSSGSQTSADAPRREPVPLGRRAGPKLPLSLSLLAAAFVSAVVIILVGAPVSPPGALPWVVLVTVAMLGVRLVWARHDTEDRWQAGCFFANLALAAVAVFLSPTFGLYLFIGFYEASLLATRWLRLTGIIATTLVIAVAQTGGPRSEIFTLPIYLAFVAITLTITLLMTGLDHQREQLMGQLEQANAELRAEQERTAVLTSRLVEQAREAGIAEERKRLSREIHDTVAQDLVAIIAQLDALSDEEDPGERRRRFGVIDSSARDALAEARRAVAALASPRLDEADLPLALDDLLGEWREGTGLGGELTVTGTPVATGHDDDLIRVVQEALANVAKHARGRRADIHLAYTPASVTVTVSDDGVGFDPDAVTRGYGLAGIRSRLGLIGGRASIRSAEGRGTTLLAELPLPNTEG